MYSEALNASLQSALGFSENSLPFFGGNSNHGGGLGGDSLHASLQAQYHREQREREDKHISDHHNERPLSVDYAAKLRNSYMSPSSVSSGGEFDSSKDGEHPLGIHPSSPSSLANRLAAAHGMSRKRNHLVDDDLMDGDNSSDIMPVVPSRQRSCSRDGGVDDIAVPDDDDDIHETDERECGNFPSLRHYDSLANSSEMKDYNANQGPLTGNGVSNEFNKEGYQREQRGMGLKEHNGRSGGMNGIGRHENGLSHQNKNKLEGRDDCWEKETSKNHLSSPVKGEDFS